MYIDFCTSGKKPFGKETAHYWAEVGFDIGDCDEYIFRPDYEETKAGKIPVFVCENCEDKVGYCLSDEALSKVAEIGNEKHSEVILWCDTSFFKMAVKDTVAGELDAELLVMENRNLLYYAPIGYEKCALLVAYEDFFGE